VATVGALEALAVVQKDALQDVTAHYLRRHVAGDWGEVDAEDRETNDWSLENEARLLSAYTLSSGVRIWIITEADRSVTTLLLPEEY
jgi:hypothetical protein